MQEFKPQEPVQPEAENPPVQPAGQPISTPPAETPGQPMTAMSPEMPPEEPPAEPEQPQPPKRSKMPLIMVIILLLVVAGVYYWFFMKKESQTIPTSAPTTSTAPSTTTAPATTSETTTTTTESTTTGTTTTETGTAGTTNGTSTSGASTSGSTSSESSGSETSGAMMEEGTTTAPKVPKLPSANKTVSATSSSSIAELEQKGMDLLEAKYPTTTIDKVTVSKSTDTHMRGMVSFTPTKAQLEAGMQGDGGIFLAAKVDGQWKLVFDGNGVIDCKLVNQYNFPSDMISDCADL